MSVCACLLCIVWCVWRWYVQCIVNFGVHGVKCMKMLYILLQDWSRQANLQTTFDSQGNQTSSQVFETPRNDVNAPDLYIPLMAFVTYVLLMGYMIAIDLGQSSGECIEIL